METLSFNDLLMRIHPAASRIVKLSEVTPSIYIVFDLLVDAKGAKLAGLPLTERRQALEAFAKRYFDNPTRSLLKISPTTNKIAVARKWFHMGTGLDGIVAKRDDLPYQTGKRTGMLKIKTQRTADCVVGGFRYLEKAPRRVSSPRAIRRKRKSGSRGIHVVDSRRRPPIPYRKA